MAEQNRPDIQSPRVPADQDRRSPGQTLLREPSLHFLLIAALMFAVYALLQGQEDNVLEIDARALEARLEMQEEASGRPLSEAERESFTRAYIEEQILVREALAMELDRDARIHDLLAQKMLHVLSGELIQPGEAQLQAFYEANRERYRVPARLNAEELVFDSREPLPGPLREALAEGLPADQLLENQPGRAGPLEGLSREDLAAIFSADFAERVWSAEPGSWTGPFLSNRGQHWLQVRERQAAHLPSRAALGDRLRLDWIAVEEEALLQRELARLWDQYNIRLVESGDGH